MSSNSIGKNFTFTTWGESHGKAIGCVIDGVPSKINLEENSFSFEPEITIKLAKKKCKFYEVPITYNGRSYEEGKKIGIKDLFIALKSIIIYSIKN